MAAVRLQRARVDRVLVLWARVLDGATPGRQWHVELNYLQAGASAVASGQQAVLAVVDHPRRATGWLVATDATIVAELPIVRWPADRVDTQRCGRAGNGVLEDDSVVAGVGVCQQFDQDRVAVEVGRRVLPLTDVTQVLRLHGTVQHRCDAQERAVEARVGAAGEHHAFVLEAQPGGAGDTDKL
ncbi:MAG TPA: hypothetical protein EYP98_13665 [Planctomycetes bacterium]|nr:hypothetical protein [Planctomycetota bacterium]